MKLTNKQKVQEMDGNYVQNNKEKQTNFIKKEALEELFKYICIIFTVVVNSSHFSVESS